MNHDQIVELVIKSVAASLCINESEVLLSYILWEDLNADDLDIVDIMFEIEDQLYLAFNLHIDLNDEKFSRSSTVNDLIELVEDNLLNPSND